MGNQIATQKGGPLSITTVRDTLNHNKEAIFAALPKHITADRMIRVVLNCIRHNPKLLKCDGDSLYGAISEAATLGLETDGILGQAYLVPYGAECTLIAGYKGLIRLARNSGEISTIQMEVVRQGDDFRYALGLEADLYHVPNDADPDRENKPITYVYAVVKLKDGGVQFKVWSTARIDDHKAKYSKAWQRAESGKKDSPWHTNWDVMAKKTVIRDMINRGEVPVSIEAQRLAMRDEVIDAGVVQPDALDVPKLTLDALADDLEAETGKAEPAEEKPDGTDWAAIEAEIAATTTTTDAAEVFHRHEKHVVDIIRLVKLVDEHKTTIRGMRGDDEPATKQGTLEQSTSQA